MRVRLHRYTGRRYDAETGLYYYRARYYSPTLGRFLQTDPPGYNDDLNLYTYVGNDPANNVDPSGQIIDTLADIGFIAYDLYELATNPSWTNAGALGADVVGAAVPFATGLGAGVRAAAKVEKAVEGSRAGKEFTKRGKEIIDQRNVSKHGKPTCEGCGKDVVPGQKSEKGKTPPANERQRDHIVPRSKGGDGTPANGQVLCRQCNLQKGAQSPEGLPSSPPPPPPPPPPPEPPFFSF